MKNKLKTNIIEAMKSGDKELLSVLKMIKNEVGNKEKRVKKELSETDIVSVLKDMRKSRKESIGFYKKGNREDLVKKEQYEIDIIDTYTPVQMTEEETILIVEKIIEEVKPESMRDMGKVLTPNKSQYGAVMDLSFVSKYVKTKIIQNAS